MPRSTLIEDRVVLFQATDFDDAIKQAKTEARRYRKATRFVNIYGQSVRLKFLSATDAFQCLTTSRVLTVKCIRQPR